MKLTIWLTILTILLIACIPTETPTIEPPPTDTPGPPPTETPVPPTGIEFVMAFANRPSPEDICDWPVVFTRGSFLKNQAGEFDSTLLEAASACGTKLILALSDRTSEVTRTGGGLDLDKFRQKVAFYAGNINPWVENGTILAHNVVDEPHDCQDWENVCPSAPDVDQAAAISRELWPTLLTSVNTLPRYLNNENYTWVNTDLIMFQYAYHKGSLETFVQQALESKRFFPDLAWGAQVNQGGCDTFGGCPMSPAQLVEVSTAMCSTGQGKWMLFATHRPELLTPEILAAIEQVKTICNPVIVGVRSSTPVSIVEEPMELGDLVGQYGALAGVAGFVAMLVNALKTFGVVKDGQAATYSLVLNLVGFVGFIALGVFRLDVDPAAVDTLASQITNIALLVLGLFVQLGTSKGTHEAVKTVPLVGKSFAKEKGEK